MKKILIFFILNTYLFAGTLIVQNGWNMLGTACDIGSENIIAADNEKMYLFRQGQWHIVSQTDRESLRSGEGFWFYSQSSREITLAADSCTQQQALETGWNFISPLESSIILNEQYPAIKLAWRYKDREWNVYTKDGSNYGFQTFNTVDMGKGVWIKNDNNALIGDTPVLITNGAFSTVSNEKTTAVSQEEFFEDIKEQFNIGFYIDQAQSNTQLFKIGVKLTYESTTHEYYLEVGTSQNPLVRLYKNDGTGMETQNVNLPIEIDNNNFITLRFDNIVKYLVDAQYFTFEQMLDRFGKESDYTIELVAKNLTIAGSQTTDSTINIANRNFGSGASRFTGVLSID